MVSMVDILTDAQKFVEQWAENRSLNGDEYAELRLQYRKDLKLYHYDQAKRKAEAKEGEVVTVKRIRSLKMDELNDAFEVYIKKIPITKRLGLGKIIECTSENLEPLKKWVTAVTGDCSDTDLNVMAHWVWLIKRNLYELPVVHHIMPIIVSPQKMGSKKQGGGKSTAITMLISPMEDVSTTLRMDQVSDDRNFTLFNNYLIAFLDEMAGSKKVEIEDFKRIVTADKLMYRPMRTNAQVRIKNLCSFIGASNNTLPDIVKDTTGNRRFFQLNALETLNHSMINSIDYSVLWQGVDERLDRGYYEKVKQEIVAIQNEISVEDDLETFFEDYSLYPHNGNVRPISVQKLYDEYILYSKRRGIHFQLQYKSFCHKVKNLGIQTDKKRDSRGIRYLVAAVNAEHVLEERKTI